MPTEQSTETKSVNKGGRPRKKLDTSSPEFKEAVAAHARALMPELTAQIAQQLASLRGSASAQEPAPSAPSVDVKSNTDDKNFVRELALAIAEVSDQGNQRKRVSPEILAKREEARSKMMSLIIQAHAHGQKPWYVVTHKTYLNEILIEPYRVDVATKKVVAQEIMWEGVPNEAMAPKLGDAVSGAIYEQFMIWIGGSTAHTKRSRSNNRGMDADLRSFGVTAGGLVIKGFAPKRRTLGNLADSNDGSFGGPMNDAPAVSPFEHGLVIGNPSDPSAEHVRVLGTVAEPARQNHYPGSNAA